MPSERWQRSPTLSGRKATFVSNPRQAVREGEVIIYTVIWAEFAVLSNPVTTVYRNGSDVSSDILTGSESAGTIQVARTITIPAGYGGSVLVVEFTVQSGGETRKTAAVLDVLARGQEGG